jgi:hypothetical protein
MSGNKPKNQTLRQTKTFVERDVFFTPIVTSEVTLYPEHLPADDAFPRAAAVLEPKTLSDLLTALDILHRAFSDGDSIPIPRMLMGPIIAAVDKLIDIHQPLHDRSTARHKKSEELKARCQDLMDRKGLSKREAARRIVEDEFPKLSSESEDFRRNWETLRKKI